jgi:prolyl-tRNA synthetase
VGRKTVRERFAGATSTMTLEAMMGDGKALQMGTSHELGQNFARAFGIDFLDASSTRQVAWTTSWGTSTRMLGGLVMTHGDDDGLRVPPRLAALQVLVTVVKDGAGVPATARQLVDDLAAAGLRVELDDRVDTPFGRRAVDAELKGVPVRVEVGPRDLAAGSVTLVRRVPGTKTSTPVGSLVADVVAALAADHQALYDEALARRDAATVDAATLAEAAEAAAVGWARVPWSAVGVDGEAQLAGRGFSVRCLVRPDGGVPEADDEPDALAVVARAY